MNIILTSTTKKNKKRKREENKDENKSIKKLRRTSVYDRRWEEQTENEINFPDQELSLMEFIEPMEEETMARIRISNSKMSNGCK